MRNFEDYCEEIFEDWMKSSSRWNDFAGNFLLDHVPEPYYTIKEGKRVLYVLNYNPGYGLDIQLMDNIRKHEHDSFRTVSSRLSRYYMNTLQGPARNRNEKILKFASSLGFDGIKCVETFYLHSAQFNGQKFLRKYGNHEIVRKYTQVLTDYLRDKPVLAIGAFGANATIEGLKAGSNPWLNFRCSMIGLDLRDADFLSFTERNNRPTSGVFIGKNRKMTSVMMGSNSLPDIVKMKHTLPLLRDILKKK